MRYIDKHINDIFDKLDPCFSSRDIPEYSPFFTRVIWKGRSILKNKGSDSAHLFFNNVFKRISRGHTINSYIDKNRSSIENCFKYLNIQFHINTYVIGTYRRGNTVVYSDDVFELQSPEKLVSSDSLGLVHHIYLKKNVSKVCMDENRNLHLHYSINDFESSKIDFVSFFAENIPKEICDIQPSNRNEFSNIVDLIDMISY